MDPITQTYLIISGIGLVLFIPEIFARLGYASLKKKHFAKAAKFYDISSALNPFNSALIYSAGLCYLALKDGEKALTRFNRSIKLVNFEKKYVNNSPMTDKKYAYMYSYRGLAHLLAKNREMALRDINRALNDNPGFITAFLHRGSVYYEFREYEKALEDYKRLINSGSDNVETRILIVIVYLIMGKIDKAAEEIEIVIKRDKENAKALYWRGILKMVLEDYENGIEDFKKAVEKAPEEGDFNIGHSLYCIYQEDYDKALEFTQKNLDLNNRSQMAYIIRFHINLYLKKYKDCIMDMDKLISFEDNSAIPYYNRALAYMRMNNLEKAKEDLEKTFSMEKLYFYHFRIGTLKLYQKDYCGAVLDYGRYIHELDKNKGYITPYGRIIVNIKLPENKDFIEALDKAVEQNPDSYELFFIRGMEYYYLKEYDKALQNFENTLKLNDESRLLLYFLGRSYHKMSNREKACIYYNKFLKDLKGFYLERKIAGEFLSEAENPPIKSAG